MPAALQPYPVGPGRRPEALRPALSSSLPLSTFFFFKRDGKSKATINSYSKIRAGVYDEEN